MEKYPSHKWGNDFLFKKFRISVKICLHIETCFRSESLFSKHKENTWFLFMSQLTKNKLLSNMKYWNNYCSLSTYLALCGPTLACSNDDEAWIWLSPITPDSMPRGPMQVAEMWTRILKLDGRVVLVKLNWLTSARAASGAK